MAQAAAAAYKTVGSDFAINSLTTFFMSGPNPSKALRFKVHRSSDGGRFVTRLVFVKQNDTTMVQVFCSFVRASALGGPVYGTRDSEAKQTND